MNDIFTDHNIYPHEGKIKDHFKDHYDSVFIALLPFLKVDREPTSKTNFGRPEQIDYEKEKHEFDILKNTPPFDADSYNYSNEEFPTDEEIFEKGQIISWDTIIKGSGLADYTELHKALRTSIGALRRLTQRPELADKLIKFTDAQSIWHPIEGRFDTLSKIAIYKAFKLIGKNQIIVTDEFYERTLSLDLDKLTDFNFTEKVRFKDYYLYSSDKEILFTIDWDSFFFLIATDSEKMQRIINAGYFAGFLCNEKTGHEWDHTDGEFAELSHIKEKQRENKATPKNPWLKFWN